MAFVERACDRGQHLDPLLLTVYRLSTLEAEFSEEEKISRFACDEKAVRWLSKPDNELNKLNFLISVCKYVG